MSPIFRNSFMKISLLKVFETQFLRNRFLVFSIHNYQHILSLFLKVVSIDVNSMISMRA
jgi:hypothetical protein